MAGGTQTARVPSRFTKEPGKPTIRRLIITILPAITIITIPATIPVAMIMAEDTTAAVAMAAAAAGGIVEAAVVVGAEIDPTFPTVDLLRSK